MLLHPAALRALGGLGVLSAVMESGASVERLLALTSGGRVIMNVGYADFGMGRFAIGIQRGTLHRLLRDADAGREQVRGGANIVDVDPSAGYLRTDTGAWHGPFDLVVVADGTYSRLRDRLSLSMRWKRPSGSAAMVGLVDDPRGVAGNHITQYFDGTFHLSLWPVGRESRSSPTRCSIAMNVALENAEAFLDRGLWRERVAQLHPGILDLVDASKDGVRWRIFTYQDVELNECFKGRAVVIGDAAHSMSPQLGTGAQLAMEDAAMLAQAIDDHDDVLAALRRYSVTRSSQLRRYHRLSRWLTPLFQSESRLLATVRDRMLGDAMRTPLARRVVQTLLS